MKKKTTKWLIGFALILGFALVISGCSGNGAGAGAGSSRPNIPPDLETLVRISHYYIENDFYTLQVSNETGDDIGSDIADLSMPWVTAGELSSFRAAIQLAENNEISADEFLPIVRAFADTIRADGSNIFFRGNPGPGLQFITGSFFNASNPADTDRIRLHRTIDNRVPGRTANPITYLGSSAVVIDNPFNWPVDGRAEKALLVTVNNGEGGSVTGAGFRMPLSTSIDMRDKIIEFDLYYPKSAEGQWLRIQIWSDNVSGEGGTYSGQGGSTGGGIAGMTNFQIRTENLRDINHLNPDWVTEYEGQSWFFQSFSGTSTVTGNTNQWPWINIDFHAETNAVLDGEQLILTNIRILEPDATSEPVPALDLSTLGNPANLLPMQSVYNRANGLFPIGSVGLEGDGQVLSGNIRGRHYSIFTAENNHKPNSTHPRTPAWLRTAYTGTPAWSGTNSTSNHGGTAPAYNVAITGAQALRDTINPFGPEYFAHYHVLAWYNQSAAWMGQIRPATLPMGYTPERYDAFYALGNAAPADTTTMRPISIEHARRIQYDHIMHAMRRFYSTEEFYGSSETRDIIPFASWDVINEELHESRHSTLINQNPNEWRSALKHTNWLVAMSDDKISGDVKEHYLYLLFKYAHIAVPNQKMADNWDRLFAADEIPQYMLDGGHHRTDGIQSFVHASPPLLAYNDYGTNSPTKSRAIYNMFRELNQAWREDPWYDGRPLIEVMGMQGHDSAGRTLASDNERSIAMFASLIDEGLLSGISFSELDIRLPTTIPGGGTTFTQNINQAQADVLGYQYALLYQMFNKWSNYITHIIHWGTSGAGWGDSFLPFGSGTRVTTAYYGAMNPAMFVMGHPYLDEFFTSPDDSMREWDKVSTSYMPDLGPNFPGPIPNKLILGNYLDKDLFPRQF